jgi:hypothetical protein
MMGAAAQAAGVQEGSEQGRRAAASMGAAAGKTVGNPERQTKIDYISKRMEKFTPADINTAPNDVVDSLHDHLRESEAQAQ